MRVAQGYRVVAFMYFVVLALSACGSVTLEPPTIASFTVSKNVLAKGGTTSLVAEFDGGVATVDNGVGEITSGVPITVSPGTTTTYKLRVVNGEGAEASSELVVDVFDALITVSTTDQSGLGSLSAAVTQANTLSGNNAIVFSLPTPATIELATTLVIRRPLVVFGPGANSLTLSGAGARRLFFVAAGGLTVRGATLTRGLGAGGRGGSGPSGGGGGGGAGMGGALFINAGDVVLRDVVVTENVARGGDGGTGGSGGLANGGGGGGFGGNGVDGSATTASAGGVGANGGELGGTGGAAGAAAIGDGGGGGGAGAGEPQNGGAGGFGGGGGGAGGFPNAGAGGFGGGAGGGSGPVGGMFGGTAGSGRGGGGGGLGGAVFLRAGSLTVLDSRFLANRAVAGVAAPGGVATPAAAKAGAIFAMVDRVTLTGVTFEGSVAADAAGTPTDSVDLFVLPPP
jgi:hypothetical protein